MIVDEVHCEAGRLSGERDPSKLGEGALRCLELIGTASFARRNNQTLCDRELVVSERGIALALGECARSGFRVSSEVPRYFFDTTDGDHFVRDKVGLVLDGIAEARDEATAGLADLARDAIPGRIRRELFVGVRDEADWPVLRAALWFEVQRLA